MTTTFTIGQEVRFAASFLALEDGPLTDPSTVTLLIIQPNETELTYTYAASQIVKDSVGVYHFDFILTSSGYYQYRWESDGAVITALEGVIFVPPSRFDDSIPMPAPPAGTGDDGKIARVQGGVYLPYAGVATGDVLRWTGSAWVSSTISSTDMVPGGGDRELQYNNAGALDGTSGIKVSSAAGEYSLRFFGPSAITPSTGGFLNFYGGSTILSGRNAGNSGDVSLLMWGQTGTDKLRVGHEVTGWEADVASGGTFSLLVGNTAEYTLDATALTMNDNNLLMGAGFAAFGSPTATQGTIRFPTTGSIFGRTNDNTAEINFVQSDASDNLIYGGNNRVAGIQLRVKTAGAHNLYVNNVLEYGFSSTTADFKDNSLQFGTNPAGSGLIRVPHQATAVLGGRNSANTADTSLLFWGAATDVLQLGTSPGGVDGIAEMRFKSTLYSFQVAGANEYVFSATVADFKDNSLQFGTNPAGSGLIRIPHNVTALAGRDAANTTDCLLMRWGVGLNERIEIGSGTTTAAQKWDVKTGGVFSLSVNNTDAFTFETTKMFVANTTAAPGNPTGGGHLYAEGGAGKWRGSSGTITTFGPAEPHCPRCDRDFAHEWESARYGKLSVCMSCLVDALERAGVPANDFVIERKVA